MSPATTIERLPAPEPSVAPARRPTRRIGFACAWTDPPTGTWSGTPSSLLQALRSITDVEDLGVHPGRALTTLHRLRALRRHQGRWVSPWRYTEAWQQTVEHQIQDASRRQASDAVIEIGDLALVDRPFAIYQDLSYDAVLDAFDHVTGATPHFPGLDRDDLRRCRDRQHRLYAEASIVFTMSHWLAGSLIGTGVEPEKVRVVHPGRQAPGPESPPRVRRRPRRRLLFVGRDFRTKGGDLVVDALRRLRSEVDPSMTLTVAGPVRWPLPGPVPTGVYHLGPVPGHRLPGLFERHDLLVMPSRLEGFGKVFVEALAHGLPCVGRAAFAMPEIITPGVDGALVAGDDVDQLAATVAAVLDDDGLYESCAGRWQAVARHYRWDRAASEMVAALGEVTS